MCQEGYRHHIDIQEVDFWVNVDFNFFVNTNSLVELFPFFTENFQYKCWTVLLESAYCWAITHFFFDNVLIRYNFWLYAVFIRSSSIKYVCVCVLNTYIYVYQRERIIHVLGSTWKLQFRWHTHHHHHHHTEHLIFVFIKFAWINLIYLILSSCAVWCDRTHALYCVKCKFFYINMTHKKKWRNKNDFVRWCTRKPTACLRRVCRTTYSGWCEAGLGMGMWAWIKKEDEISAAR